MVGHFIDIRENSQNISIYYKKFGFTVSLNGQIPKIYYLLKLIWFNVAVTTGKTTNPDVPYDTQPF